VEKLPGWADALRGSPERWKNLVSTARSLQVLDWLLPKRSRRPDRVFFACVNEWRFYHSGALRMWIRWKWAGCENMKRCTWEETARKTKAVWESVARF
jgi:hypothetical protein